MGVPVFIINRDFLKQLEEEVGRAKRYGTSFSLLLFQISNLQQLQSIYKKQDIMFIKKLWQKLLPVIAL